MRAAEATQSPSSEKPTAPARGMRPISASSSPWRPLETAPTGKTRQRPVRSACLKMNSTIASSSIAGVVFGMHTTVVKPPATAASVPVAMVSASSCPGSRRWTWGSIRPGQTRQPSASMMRSAGPRARRGPMPAIDAGGDGDVGGLVTAGGGVDDASVDDEGGGHRRRVAGVGCRVPG